MKITIAVMRKHLVLLNKSLRKDMLVSGVSKMKGESVKQNFNERFSFDESRKHYMPNEKFFDELEPEISAGSFEDLMPKEKPKKNKKSTHKMPDGTVMTGAKHNKNSKEVKKPVKFKVKKADAPKKAKKERSAKQKANDKKLGVMAKKRAVEKKKYNN